MRIALVLSGVHEQTGVRVFAAQRLRKLALTNSEHGPVGRTYSQLLTVVSRNNTTQPYWRLMGLAILTGSAGLIGSEAATFFFRRLFGASKVAADFLGQEYGPNHSGHATPRFPSYLMKCTMTGKHNSVFGYGIETACHGRYVLNGLGAA
jgi:hypothetical protein